MQVAPSARHVGGLVPLKQQPLLQVLPGQQGSPTAPHRAHRDELVLQTEPVSHRSVPLVPGQQLPPALPQGEQMLFRQESPAPQLGVMVPQHGCPEAPHPAHFPAPHMPGLVPVVPPVPAVVGPQDVPSATHCSL